VANATTTNKPKDSNVAETTEQVIDPMYPGERQSTSHFGLRYIKWLSDSGIAMEVGPDAFALLVAVVTQEDTLRYLRAPNFYNDQLSMRCGIGSEPALIRARKRAIDNGLLFYSAGAKRRPGIYFVTGFTNDSFANPERIRSESVANAEGIRSESFAMRLPSTPIPIPIPIPIKREKRPTFAKPTIEEVQIYCKERKSSVNAERFVNYYEANGWTQGRNKPIRDWKASVRTWEQNEIQTAKPISIVTTGVNFDPKRDYANAQF